MPIGVRWSDFVAAMPEATEDDIADGTPDDFVIAWVNGAAHRLPLSLIDPTFSPTRLELAILGDSIALGGYTGPNLGQSSPLNWGAVESQQRIAHHYNGGVGGDWSDDALARVSDIVAANPRACIVSVGTNDVNGGVPTETIGANLAAIYDALAANGIEPIAATLTPRTTFVAQARALSLWIENYAAVNGLRILDFHAVTANGAGAWLPGYSTDNLHPTPVGAQAMGQLIASTIAPVGTEPGITLPIINADPGNTVKNGLFEDDVNADNVPDNWQGALTGTGSHAIVTDPDVLGNWYVLTRTGGAGQVRLRQTMNTTDFSITGGDRVRLCGRIRTTGIEAGGGNWVVNFIFRDAALAQVGDTYYPMGTGQTNDVDDGVFSMDIDVPVGADRWWTDLIVSSGTGSIKFAQFAVWKLT